jgi:hypothetical protein
MSKERLPIVLAHGIARFDIILEILRTKLQLPESELGDRFQYFKRIKSSSSGVSPNVIVKLEPTTS